MWPCSRSSFGLPCCIRGDPFEKPIEVPLSVGAMQVLAMQGEKEGCLVTKLYHTIITRVKIIYTRARKRVCIKEYTITSFKIATSNKIVHKKMYYFLAHFWGHTLSTHAVFRPFFTPPPCTL